MYLQKMTSFQRNLSVAQATPVVGFIAVSPVKAVVSIAQIIVGLSGAILCGSASIVLNKGWLTARSLILLGHAGVGGISFCYSVSNILTLGFMGRQIEYIEKRDPSRVQY